MVRLAKYLKPYTLMILITIALLFIQANADLALPDYMSKIVNNGIQQGGVENAVPIAIRKSEMDRLVIFLNAEEKNMVLGNYLLVDINSPDYEKYLAEYPTIADQPIYVRNEIDKNTIAQLNLVMGKTELVVSSLEKMVADPTLAAGMGQSLGFDVTKIPPGMDVFSMLQMLPAAQLEKITSGIDEKFSSLGDSMINQMAVGFVKTEYGELGMDTSLIQTIYILTTGAWMLLLSLLSVTCTIIVGFLSAKVAAGGSRTLRRDVFTKVESFSNTEFDKFSTASLITRTTNDITQIQMVVVMIMRMVFYAPIIGVGGIIRAIGKSANMWWIIAVAVVTLLGLIVVVFSIALPKFKIIQKLIDRLNLVTREHLSGMMVIRAFNMQIFEEDRFDKANKDLTSNTLFIARVMVVLMPLMMMIMNGLSLAIIWVGAHQVANNAMQVGDMMAFMQYAMQIVMAFLMLSMMFIILPRASVSAGRVADVLETGLAINDPVNPKIFAEPFHGKVEFRNVSFRYPDAQDDVLHNISFIAQPGQTTAFIGSTGSGKSTVVNLLPRFYEVSDGAIYVDDIDIREVSQADLRDKIGYIPQKGMLFSGSVESNLRYADEDASEDSLKEATDIAQASEFIFEKPEGLETEISQGGSNVSGGQKQRLSIARALVKKPPIYIFDDSFSALDFKTESALRKSLKKNTGDSNVLIVTQRVSTIKNVEQIIVLEEGRIVGKGCHEELMETCEPYQEIALSQLSKEELS